MALGESSPSDYPALFRNYLKRAARSALQPPTPQDTYPETGGYERTSQLIHTLNLALQSPELWSEARELLFTISDTLERTARHADLIPLLEAALRQSEAAGDMDTRARLQIRLAILTLSQTDGERSRALLSAALDYFEARGDTFYTGQVLNGLGRWAIQRGNFTEAVARARAALALLPDDAVNERAVSYRLLGGEAMERQAWEEAHTTHLESLRLWQQGGNPRFIGFGWVNVGSVLRGLGQYEPAASAFREGIARFEAAEDLVNRAYAQTNLGNLYLDRALYREAIEQYHAAETLFRQLNRIYELARIYNNWGMAYAGLGQWEAAVGTYEQSLRYWGELQNVSLQANTLDNLGLALSALGRYAESASIFRAALAALPQEDGTSLREEMQRHLAQVEHNLNRDNEP